MLEDARTLLVEEDVGVDEVVSQLQDQQARQREINDEVRSRPQGGA